MPEISRVPILDELRDLRKHPGRYESALLTSYNASLPFFEELVLRRLEACGCQHVVLATDARVLAAALDRPEQRPNRAGRDYTLTSVQVPGGAFHPKLLLLLGKDSGRLYLGSHNLTYSGLCTNRELTSRVNVEGPRDRSEALLLRDALEFILGWLPDARREPARQARRFAPWLDGPAPAAQADIFVGSTPTGPSLWARVSEHIPRNCRRVTLVSAFFDQDLAFVRHLLKTMPGVEIVVGVEPASVVIDPSAARSLRGVRFVEVGPLGGDDDSLGYLHAKAALFSASREAALVIGSANASAAAWLAGAGHRNAEAVFVRTADGAARAAGAIGLDQLSDAPAVAHDAWSAIADRFQAAVAAKKKEETAAPVLHFVEAEDGLACDDVAPLGRRALTARVWTPGTRDASTASVTVAATRAVLGVSADVKASASLVQLEAAGEGVAWGIVHHPDALAERATSGVQRQLRHALGALEDGAQLDSMLKMVNKVIFEAPVHVHALRSASRKKASEDTAAGWEERELSVQLAASSSHGRIHRAIASGDIALILDALNRRLAEGLVMTKLAPERTDEAIVETDEPALVEPPPDLPDIEDLAALCRRKTGSLLRRMTQHLELARTDEGASERVIVQLAAVLAVARSIRRAQNRDQWRKVREGLMHDEALAELFWSACEVLGGPKGLLARAAERLTGVLEVSEVLEHLGWAAYDLELDFGPFIRKPQEGDDEPDPEALARAFADLVLLAEMAAGDPPALERLERTLGTTPVRGRDVSTFTTDLGRLGAAVRAARTGAALPKLRRPLVPGDVVRLGKTADIGTVVAVRNRHVDIVNEVTRDDEKTFLADALVGFDWAGAGSRRHVG